MNQNNIDTLAITIIYPDGSIESIPKDERIYHMEYMYSLIDNSIRLKEIIKRKKIYLPTDIDEIKYMLSYEICTKFAESGLIVINNLSLDEEIEKEEDWPDNFNVYLPSELTSDQKTKFINLLNNNIMENCWFGQVDNGEMIDIDFSEVEEILKENTK